jgi:hypothetical protein
LKHKFEGDFMKKFWMLILAAIFVMNSGVASVFAQEEAVSAVSAVTETAEPIAEEALLTEETTLEEAVAVVPAVTEEKKIEEVPAVVEEVVEDEFSDDFAMETDTAEGAMEDMTVGGLPADQKAY